MITDVIWGDEEPRSSRVREQSGKAILEGMVEEGLSEEVTFG